MRKGWVNVKLVGFCTSNQVENHCSRFIHSGFKFGTTSHPDRIYEKSRSDSQKPERSSTPSTETCLFRPINQRRRGASGRQRRSSFTGRPDHQSELSLLQRGQMTPAAAVCHKGNKGSWNLSGTKFFCRNETSTLV